MTDSNSFPGQGSQGFYDEVAKVVALGHGGVIITVIGTDHSSPRHVGSRMLIRADGSICGTVGGGRAEAEVMQEAEKVMADGVCRRLVIDLHGEKAACGGTMEFFLEPVDTATPLWIIGAGHVGRAVAEFAGKMPLRITVVDDRPEFLQDLPCGIGRRLEADELQHELKPTTQTAVIVAMRNHTLDGDYTEAVLRAERDAGRTVGYLGVIGSRHKSKVLRARLAGEFDAGRLERLRLPVGLSIAAETPAEIAVSILAEMLADLRADRVDWQPDAAGRSIAVRREQFREG